MCENTMFNAAVMDALAASPPVDIVEPYYQCVLTLTSAFAQAAGNGGSIAAWIATLFVCFMGLVMRELYYNDYGTCVARTRDAVAVAVSALDSSTHSASGKSAAAQPSATASGRGASSGSGKDGDDSRDFSRAAGSPQSLRDMIGRREQEHSQTDDGGQGGQRGLEMAPRLYTVRPFMPEDHLDEDEELAASAAAAAASTSASAAAPADTHALRAEVRELRGLVSELSRQVTFAPEPSYTYLHNMHRLTEPS